MVKAPRDLKKDDKSCGFDEEVYKKSGKKTSRKSSNIPGYHNTKKFRYFECSCIGFKSELSQNSDHVEDSKRTNKEVEPHSSSWKDYFELYYISLIIIIKKSHFSFK